MVRVGTLFASIADKLLPSRRSARRTAKVFFLLVGVCTGVLVYIFRSQDHNPPIVRRHTRNSQSQRSSAHSVPVQNTHLKFPHEYHAKGVLSLPYGDIVEPFEVWYSDPHGMSRIDYYGGMDRTYQRTDLGKHGFACKIVPEFSEKTEKTFEGCLHRQGTKQFPIKPQSIIPTFEFFKFEGYVDFRGKECIKWKHSFKIYNKVNTYTFYTSHSRPYTPVRYEMMGYDTLLSSYYDHYILEYHTFNAWKYDYRVFKIPTNLNCFDFSKDRLVGAQGEINPMVEFMPHRHAGGGTASLVNTTTPPKTTIASVEASEDSLEYLLEQLKKMPITDKSTHPTVPTTRGHTTTPSMTSLDKDPDISYQATLHHYEDVLSQLFSLFKIAFKKDYKSLNEHEKRRDIYRHNMRFIKSRNRQHLTYKLKPNHMADMTGKEIELRKGLLHGAKRAFSGGKTFVISEDVKGVMLPIHVDWRKTGAVNPVKSQGICGSCYAFAVAGALEGAHFIKTGKRMHLSEQQIVDCTWGFGNRGCKGGYPYRAMQWILKHGGLATEESYGKYLAQEGYCHFKNTTIGAKMHAFMNIRKGNTTELKMAVAFYGPVTILINTQPKSFKFYGSGIYYDTQCTHALDHAALAVGYGVEKGVPYWLVKNSWSEVWGDKGYIRIAMKDDSCGVAQKAVVVSAKV